MEHRATAEQRKPVPIEINDIDVGSSRGDPFFEDVSAFVDERINQALDDLLVGDPPRGQAGAAGILADHLRDSRRGMCSAVTGLVVVPAAPGLLSETASLANEIRDLRRGKIGPLFGTALPDGPADVVAGQIAHAEGPHREAE